MVGLHLSQALQIRNETLQCLGSGVGGEYNGGHEKSVNGQKEHPSESQIPSSLAHALEECAFVKTVALWFARPPLLKFRLADIALRKSAATGKRNENRICSGPIHSCNGVEFFLG
mmetsp:Transcript_26768/g.79107  ORF Transcript_26768/g.79107 Transcript_26768/m.79107 type:complete len:115 (-) Transcript_26768:553-897(-)